MTENNWVKARAACTLDSVLDDLLARVSTDIKQVNNIPVGRRRGHIGVTRCVANGFEVHWVPEHSPAAFTGDCVTFRIARNGTICFRRPEQEPRQIHIEWDGDAACCFLTVDGERRELWQISQMSLERFFFDGIDQ